MAAITIDNATLTIERATVRHAVLRKHVIRKLLQGLSIDTETADDLLVELILDYGRLVSQATCATDAPVWLASHSDSIPVLVEKFNAWCDTDESTYRALSDALREVNEPLTPEHLTPDATPKKKR